MSLLSEKTAIHDPAESRGLHSPRQTVSDIPEEERERLAKLQAETSKDHEGKVREDSDAAKAQNNLASQEAQQESEGKEVAKHRRIKDIVILPTDQTLLDEKEKDKFEDKDESEGVGRNRNKLESSSDIYEIGGDQAPMERLNPHQLKVRHSSMFAVQNVLTVILMKTSEILQAQPDEIRLRESIRKVHDVSDA